MGMASLGSGKGCCPVSTWVLVLVTVFKTQDVVLTWYMTVPSALMSVSVLSVGPGEFARELGRELARE